MGKHHGKGRLVYESTGDSYDGEWFEGDIHGEGRFAFSNGDIFAGEFENNQMKQGIMNKANGDEYAGDFVNDLFIGYSLYKYANGDIYCGDFLKGKMNGNGVLKIKQSKFDYAGKFEDNQLVHGQVLTHEGEYLGEFAPNTRAFHGRGIMKHKTGDVYDGKWSDGLMHGHGTLIYAKMFEDDEDASDDSEEAKKPSCTPMYVGDFVEGKRTEGTLTYDNCDVFTGIFNDKGMRESGVIKFANGDEFAGVFEDGAMKFGIMTFKESGDVYSGEFENSMFHGGGKMTYANGDVFSGEFLFGSKHGSGQLTLAKKKNIDPDQKQEQNEEQKKGEESKDTTASTTNAVAAVPVDGDQ